MITLAFDVGKASLGVCARTNDDILVLESYIIPVDYAATSDFRTRRHMLRTRMAHKQRETWFMEAIWLKAGLPDYRDPAYSTQPEAWNQVISGLPACYHREKDCKRIWSREFPKKGDTTVFNSALLRIMLIEGQPLAPWQIWKALWSAIQKRGFYYYNWKDADPDLESIEKNAATLRAEREELETERERLTDLKKAAKHKDEKISIEADLAVVKEKLKNWIAENESVLEGLSGYKTRLNDTVLEKRYYYPCYLEAARMGLWECDSVTRQGRMLQQGRINHYAGPLLAYTDIDKENPKQKNVINERNVHRAYHLIELRQLWEQAVKQLPVLKAFTCEYFLYGESEKPFATVWHKMYQAYRGKGPDYLANKLFITKGKGIPSRCKRSIDTQGVLGQKVPRFDNRIIAKCQLFNIRNVCKASDPSAIQFSLLTQLKHLRFVANSKNSNTLESRGFEPEELSNVYDQIKGQLNAQSSVNLTNLKAACKMHVANFSGFLSQGNKTGIKANLEGRSRFSRPALKLMNYVLLNGLNLANYGFDVDKWAAEEKVAVSDDPKKGITYEEVAEVLTHNRLGKSWHGFTVMDNRDVVFEKAKELNLIADELLAEQEKRKAVMQLIGSSNNPLVRHRLTFFYNTLVKLEKTLKQKGFPISHGSDSDDRIILEFVRGVDASLVDSKAKAKDWETAIKLGQEQNDRIRTDLGSDASRTNVQKMKLLEEQGSICVYSGKKLEETQLHLYDIDHIVPWSATIRSDALWNKVLVYRAENSRKGNLTPYDWLSKEPVRWAEYNLTIQAMTRLSKKKKDLLTSPDARKLIESYNGLAETAYVARLVQQIISLHFAWSSQGEGLKRHIFVNDGALTSRIRDLYQLGDLLLNDVEKAERDDIKNRLRAEKSKPVEERDDEAIKKLIADLRTFWKNRKNLKHHALDAFCISFSQDVRYQLDETTQKETMVIKGDKLIKLKKDMEDLLDGCFPIQPFNDQKSFYPKETSYGVSKTNGKRILAARTLQGSLYDYLLTGKDPEKIVDPVLRLDVIKQLKLDKKTFMERLQRNLKLNTIELLELKKNDLQQYNTLVRERYYLHPTYNSVVKNAKIKFTDFEYGETAPNIAAFKDKQYRDFEATKDRIIYQDKKGKWRALQLYPNHSRQKELAKLAQQGYELFNEGISMKNGTMLRLVNSIANVNKPSYSRDPISKKIKQVSEKVVLPAGLYRFAEANEELTKIGLDSADGVRYRMPFNKLLEGKPSVEGKSHTEIQLV